MEKENNITLKESNKLQFLKGQFIFSKMSVIINTISQNCYKYTGFIVTSSVHKLDNPNYCVFKNMKDMKEKCQIKTSLNTGSFFSGSCSHSRLTFVADSPQRLQSEERGRRGQEGEAERRCACPPWLIELPK